MNTVAIRANRRKLLILAFLVLLCAAGYMLVEVNFSNPKLLAYAMKIRTPKLIVMLITAFAIGGASIVFQSIINNTIVTPCLLGMNSLYTHSRREPRNSRCSHQTPSRQRRRRPVSDLG